MECRNPLLLFEEPAYDDSRSSLSTSVKLLLHANPPLRSLNVAIASSPA